ncbi:MAG: glycosyltransferase family 2 protein [Oscillospiraceae bacterium]|nr:glycosyltransferase family 2 protein [Oscillospiraceae bacterium]
MPSKISVIVPFYKGNQYLPRLFASIEAIVPICRAEDTEVEVILVNDSPAVAVELPDDLKVTVQVIANEQNMGIHGTRLHGLEHATGDWILFLDQDDEILLPGFQKQLQLREGTDVVVGNGLYEYGTDRLPIYKSEKAMKYLIQADNFLRIRNLIPSPGCCLIRKAVIPACWQQNPMQSNGSDDWLLWLLLFWEKRSFVCNYGQVYIHNDAGGNNLSFDLEKMHRSNLELWKILERSGQFSEKELKWLDHSIHFKFYQDTRQLDLKKLLKYAPTILCNVRYKLTSILLGRSA